MPQKIVTMPEKSTQTFETLSPIPEDEEESHNSFADAAETAYLVTGTAVAIIAIVCAGYAVNSWRNRWNA